MLPCPSLVKIQGTVLSLLGEETRIVCAHPAHPATTTQPLQQDHVTKILQMEYPKFT